MMVLQYKHGRAFLAQDSTTVLLAFSRESENWICSEEDVELLFSVLGCLIRDQVCCRTWLHLAECEGSTSEIALMEGLLQTDTLLGNQHAGPLHLVAPHPSLGEVIEVMRADLLLDVRQDLLGDDAVWPVGPEQEHLGALVKEPEDQAHQSAYAEWLQEQQDERAVFLRLQAALPSTIPRVVPEPVVG